jgi:hypothetical protein
VFPQTHPKPPARNICPITRYFYVSCHHHFEAQVPKERENVLLQNMFYRQENVIPENVFYECEVLSLCRRLIISAYGVLSFKYFKCCNALCSFILVKVANHSV